MDPDSARLHHGAAQSKATVGRGVAYRRMAWEVIQMSLFLLPTTLMEEACELFILYLSLCLTLAK